MFERLGHFSYRRRKVAVIIFVIGILAAGGVGSTVFSRLDSGGYSNPKSDSYKVYNYINDTLKIADPTIVVVVDAGDTDISDPAVTQRALALEAKMAKENGVSKTLSYWSSGGEQAFKSKDGKAGYILVYSSAEAFSPASEEMGAYFQDNYDGKVDGFTLYSGGVGVVGNAINKKISKDLAIAEAISIPATFILLVFVFGAMVASAMPLIVGVSAILGAFLFSISSLSSLMSVSTHSTSQQAWALDSVLITRF